MARPSPDGSTISCDYSRIILSTTSPPASLWHRILGHFSSLSFLVPDGMFRMRLLQPCLQDQWDFLDDQFQVSWFPLYREFFFSGGLQWPSSSVRPEGLKTPVGRPVGHSVLRQHHHGSVCPSPAAIHHGLVQYQSGRSQSPLMVIGPEWTLHQDIVDQLVHKWPAMIRLFRPP